MNKFLSTTALSAVILTGCTLSPKYERPAAPVAQAWSGQTNVTINGVTNTADIDWREFFNEPRLQQLIGLSLTNNRDLRVAVLNVEQARAQYRITRSDLFPKINANGSGLRQRIPGDLSGTGQPVTLSQYNVSLGVTAYELDLFGRIRSLKAQALERYFASSEVRKSAQISLIAEVAVQYLSERELDEQLKIAKQTLEAWQASYDLNKQSYDVGNASELELRSAETQVQTARANVALFTRLRAQAENALVLLIGQPLPAELPAAQPLSSQQLLADLPAGLPSDLLQRRPDIRAAEHQLKAANAVIGAARAAFFPTITLTGSAGTSSAELAGLFTGGSAAWSFSPQITLPIFEAGNNKANLDVAKVSKLIEVANYEKAIQSAFREVADALVARSSLDEQIAAEEALVNAQQQRYKLADLRYRNGVDNYLVVLLAQRDLYDAQQTLVNSRFARLANLIDLYKSLGGGWKEPEKKD